MQIKKICQYIYIYIYKILRLAPLRFLILIRIPESIPTRPPLPEPARQMHTSHLYEFFYVYTNNKMHTLTCNYM